MWASLITPNSELDKYLRLLTVIILATWLVTVGFRIENPYPNTLIELYALPITRIFLLLFVLLSAAWCPRVGILMALAYFCLGADVLFFTRHSV